MHFSKKYSWGKFLCYHFGLKIFPSQNAIIVSRRVQFTYSIHYIIIYSSNLFSHIVDSGCSKRFCKEITLVVEIITKKSHLW